MLKSIISEGKTTNEAIENGLKKLNVSKNMVDVRVIEEDKRSFFSILTPRVVKVELTVKENAEKPEKRIETREKEHREVKKETRVESEKVLNKNMNEINEAIENIKKFLEELISKLSVKDVKHDVFVKDYYIHIEITGEDIGYLIGYRGETLNSLQTVITSIANRNVKEKIRVILNIEGYREKREKALEELAEKICKTVVRTGRTITLEPMTSYERKIIHSKLQGNNKIKTFSIGEEPYRKIVVSIK